VIQMPSSGSEARQEGADFDTMLQVAKTLFRNAKSKIHPLSRAIVQTGMAKVGDKEGLMKISLNCGDLDERLGNVNLREGNFRTAVKQVEAISVTFDTRVSTWEVDKERMLAALRAAQHRAEIDKVKGRMRHIDNGIREVQRHVQKLVGSLNSLMKFEAGQAADSAESGVPTPANTAKTLRVDESLLLSPEEMDRLVFGKKEPDEAAEPAEPPKEAPRRPKSPPPDVAS
jgi:hypothetical protein